MIALTIKNLISDKSRSAIYKKNIVLSSFFQMFSLGISFMLVPLTFGYLGIEEYGVWVTLANLVAWFAFFDVGLGHGLRNKYAESKANNNEVEMKKYVSTTFFCLIAISIIIMLGFNTISYFVNWSYVLNAPASMADELGNLAFILITMFCINFVLNIINVLLTADQEPSTPILITGLGNLMSLVLVYIITKTTEPSLLYIGMALSFSQLFPLLCAFFYLFKTKYKFVRPSFKFFSREHTSSVFSLGIRFFLIQLTALILLQGNNIIIAHACDLRDVTFFNIAFKYISILYIVFTASLSPLWSASTDAYTKGDITWIKNTVRKLNHLWVLIIGAGVIMVVVSPFSYKIWLNHSFEPDYMLLSLILIYFIFLSKSTIYRSFMNGTGKIFLQFYVTMIQSFIHIPLAYVFGKYFGVNGVVMVMILWSVINSTWEKIQFTYLLDGKATGVWNK